MGFREELLSIQLKPYQPVHSAKVLNDTYRITNEDFLKKKPNLRKSQTRPSTGATIRTCITSRNSSRQNSSRQSSIKTRPSTCVSLKSSREYKTSSRVTSISNFSTPRPHTSSTSKKSTNKKNLTAKNDDVTNNDNNEDTVSIASTNISLVTVNSAQTDDQNLNRTYGLFNYKSYFEQYMNGRSKKKILKCNMPKNAPDFDSEYILYDLLEDFEISELLDIYDVLYPVIPSKKRAKSVSQFHPTGYDEVSKLKNTNLKRSASIECFESSYIDKKWKITERLNKNEDKKRLNEMNILERRQFLCDQLTDSLYPSFWATDLRQPSLFDLGSKHLKKFDRDSEKFFAKQNKPVEIEPVNPYEHIESKLKPYILYNQRKYPVVDLNNKQRAKTAIGIFKESSGSYDAYKNEKKENTRQNISPLKLSNKLNRIMREDLRQNKGPVYFGELTVENLKGYSGKVNLSQKYLSLYEWLLTIEPEECQHFLLNPFTKTCATNTKISNKDPERLNIDNPQVDIIKSTDPIDPKLNILTSWKYKIDPFMNPRVDYRQGPELPKRRLTTNILNNEQKLLDIKDRQILNVKKDFTTMLSLREKHAKPCENYQAFKKDIFGRNLTKADFLTTREKLKKRIQFNDTLRTRLTLDLFCL